MQQKCVVSDEAMLDVLVNTGRCKLLLVNVLLLRTIEEMKKILIRKEATLKNLRAKSPAFSISAGRYGHG